MQDNTSNQQAPHRIVFNEDTSSLPSSSPASLQKGRFVPGANRYLANSYSKQGLGKVEAPERGVGMMIDGSEEAGKELTTEFVLQVTSTITDEKK
jgi:hypothetical protein